MEILADLLNYIDDIIRYSIQNIETHIGFVMVLIVIFFIFLIKILILEDWYKP